MVMTLNIFIPIIPGYDFDREKTWTKLYCRHSISVLLLRDRLPFFFFFSTSRLCHTARPPSDTIHWPCALLSGFSPIAGLTTREHSLSLLRFLVFFLSLFLRRSRSVSFLRPLAEANRLIVFFFLVLDNRGGIILNCRDDTFPAPLALLIFFFPL